MAAHAARCTARHGVGSHAEPVALLAAGGVLVLRPVLSAVRPFRAAAACLFVAGCLGLEAGTPIRDLALAES